MDLKMLVSDAGLSCPGLGGHPVGAPTDPDGIRSIAKPSGRPLSALQRFRVRQGIPHRSLLYPSFGR